MLSICAKMCFGVGKRVFYDANLNVNVCVPPVRVEVDRRWEEFLEEAFLGAMRSVYGDLFGE